MGPGSALLIGTSPMIVNPGPRTHYIEFKTYNFFVVFQIKKVIDLEVKSLYVPEGFPENPYDEYMMYSLRAYYKFKWFVKEDQMLGGQPTGK